MAIALLFLVFVAAFVWSIARSARKLKTALIGICIMIAIESIAISTLSSAHADRSMNAFAWDAGFIGVLALPVAVLSGSIAALIASGKSRKRLATEVSH